VSATGARPKTNVNVERELAWANRKLQFDRQTIIEAVNEFNRRNRVQIYIDPSLGSQQARGTFDADDPQSFADAVAWPEGVVVHEAPDVLRIKRR
jgi:transmembrane sensor